LQSWKFYDFVDFVPLKVTYEVPSNLFAVLQDLWIIRLLLELVHVIFTEVALANAVCIDDCLNRLCFTDCDKLNFVFELKELKTLVFDFSAVSS
jgi:hypothetical protein